MQNSKHLFIQKMTEKELKNRMIASLIVSFLLATGLLLVVLW